MTKTFQINDNSNGMLVVRDSETGEEVSRVTSDTRITAATDSWDVVDACELPGKVVSVDHACENIFATVEI